MCGIFAYSGKSGDGARTVVDGLKRLEYRGYDSWGVAVSSAGKIGVRKQAGKISAVENLDLPNSAISIGHTRWATTGAVTDVNAHPHFASDESFVLAQNGIVENYQDLKEKMIRKGYKFLSETDTEVIVRLVEEKLKNKTMLEAVRVAFLELTGRNTIIALTKYDQIFAARNGSPLVAGLNPDTKEIFLSSDTLSFADKAAKAVVLDNGQMVWVKDGKIRVYDVYSGKEARYQTEDVQFSNSKVDKDGYEHFMLKEIYETPFVIRQLLDHDYSDLVGTIKKARTVYTIGSGTTGLAAAQAAFYLRSIGMVSAVSLIGAEAVEYEDLFTKDDLIIAISQSGETADVLEVLEAAKKKGVKIASFVNMPGSMMTRISDFPIMAASGPEICVMATKTLTAQLAFGYLLAKCVAGKEGDAKKNLRKLAGSIDKYLSEKNNLKHLQGIANILAQKNDIFLLGKYQNYQIVREGMVKIIEASYKRGHAMPSGDLKHYAITLMEPGTAVIVVMSNDRVQGEVGNAVDEVSLRGAEVFGIAPMPHKNFKYFVEVPDLAETSAIMNLIPLQLIAYFLAVELGNNVDKPRNIAKSVTVK